MSIRKIWIIILTFISVISIVINSGVLVSLTDRYFTDYLAESHETHMNQIVNYTKNALKSNEVSYSQMAIELETHLVDPIIAIKLYNADHELMVNAETEIINNMNMNMNMNMMQNGRSDRMNNAQLEAKNEFVVESNSEIIGYLTITSYSTVENSIVAQKFKASLIRNSVFSILFSLIIVTIVGALISKKMSKELKDTAEMAKDIQQGATKNLKSSSIIEINQIRESLDDLDIRLRLKQKSRKTVIDQLVHQSRTPLTILKTHLEGIEDGILEVDQNEITVFNDQIENLTFLISNMGDMIDANTEKSEMVIEKFEFSDFIKQILSGLNAQFNKKGIELIDVGTAKIVVETDKYKLNQILYNLFDNAYKYTPEFGQVKVNYKVYLEMLTITIEDTGKGIPEDEIDKIFRAYYRGKKATSTHGEGLGLYIVSENVKMLNGTINVESRVGKGSRFTLNIPIKNELNVRNYGKIQ